MVDGYLEPGRPARRGSGRSTGVIRLRRQTLPAGLSAVVRRTADGELEIFVSDVLEPDGQRAAVRLALRASRVAGWRAGLLPVPLVLVLASGWAGLRTVARAVTRALRAHAALSAAAGSLAVACATALIFALPHHHAPASASKLPSPSRVQASAPGRTAPAPRPVSSRRGRPGANGPRSGQAEPTITPEPARTAPPPGAQSGAPPAHQSPTPAPTSAPAPAPSATTSPAPVPTPSPTSTGRRTCIVVLGIWICL